MSEKPKIDPSSWGGNSKKVPQKNEHHKKPKDDKMDSEEEESKPPKKDRKNPMEDQLKLLMDRIQQLESQKSTPRKMIELSEILEYFEQNGPDGLKTWIHQRNRTYVFSFILNCVNYFLFK